jgi:hypothetical protein
VKNLDSYNEHKIGNIQKINFKGSEVVSEITEIVELNDGFIMIKEKMTGDKQILADYQKMADSQNNPILVTDVTPTKKWYQFWKGVQTK